jgi:hypothetical protein
MSNKYSSQEVLQILIDSYYFQSELDPQVNKGEVFTYDTLIDDWRDLCNLLPPDRLAEYYHEIFNLSTDQEELKELLNNKDNTLKTFCDYVAANGKKEILSPVVSMGVECLEASIFKALKHKLESKGFDTREFKPGAELESFLKIRGSILVESVIHLAPGALSRYSYKDNLLSRTGSWIIGISLIALSIALVTGTGYWLTGVAFTAGFISIWIGSKLKPAELKVQNFHTVRDLIIGMKEHIESQREKQNKLKPE